MKGDRCANLTIDADVGSATQSAPSHCCCAPVDVEVLPFPRAKFPGEVRYACTACGHEETPAMRAEKRVGGCHYCGGFIPPKTTNSGMTRFYCSDRCRKGAANERKLARKRAMSQWRREQKGKAYNSEGFVDGGGSTRHLARPEKTEAA